MRTLGVILWIVIAWLTGSFAWGVRRYTRKGAGVTMQTVNTSMLLATQAVLVGALHLSALHFLWMIPSAFVLGMISPVFPFSLLSIPGRAFGALCCIGLSVEGTNQNKGIATYARRPTTTDEPHDEATRTTGRESQETTDALESALREHLAPNGTLGRRPMAEHKGEDLPEEVDSAELASMHALCEEITRSTAELLASRSINKPILMVELYGFSMAVVTEVYMLASKGVRKATPTLDAFHLGMTAVIANDVFLRQNPEMSEALVDALCDRFTELLRLRYPEYRKAFREDILKPNSIWRCTSELLVQHLPAEPLTEEERACLLIPLGLLSAQTYVRAMTVVSDKQ